MSVNFEKYQEINKLVALTGSLIKDETGKWRTTNFNEQGDINGVVGDRLRVEAAVVIFQKNPNISITISGGKSIASIYPDAPDVCDVMFVEMIELGVEPKNIIKDRSVGSTMDQVKSLSGIMVDSVDSLYVLSNKYHLPRIEAMIKYFTDTNKLFDDGKIKLISAEDVLTDLLPEKWEEEIDKAYSSEAMAERIAKEKNGIEALKRGEYK
jgi:vancomycin permeability regulator SanA